MKRVLLLVIIAITFIGCAKDSDSSRFGWDDVKDKLSSVLGKDAPAR